MELTPYHARYFAHELTKRSSSASVDSLTSALADDQVDFNPHQIEAALFVFRSPLLRMSNAFEAERSLCRHRMLWQTLLKLD